jgi:hypothetical protein
MTTNPRRQTTRAPFLLALIGLVFLAASAATWFLVPPPKATARIQLHVSPFVQRFLPKDNREGVWQNELFLKTQAIYIRDRFSLAAVLRDPQIANLSTIKEQEDPVQWLENNLMIDYPSPEFIRISLSGDRKGELAKIVSAVANTYWDIYCNKEHKDREEHKRRLEKLQGKLKKELDQKKNILKSLQQRKDGAELADMMNEIEQLSKLYQKASDSLLQMDVEREEPPRVAQPAKDAILYTPNEANRNPMKTGGAATLAGLGILFLALAVFWFHAHKAIHLVDDLPGLSLPE